MARAFLAIALAAAAGCASSEWKAAAKMEIGEVDVAAVPDGDHLGAFSCDGVDYRVSVSVADHRITAVRILSNRDEGHARKAEGVAAAILERQTPRVDAVTGATVSSKILMKAAENALRGAVK
ncbi:MAG: FMN-binding protein [Planctomycetes bacterium]|jgi:uncharacterized protein with FMN-binding domain|nr:FMN-binding protein [Planctomycetota bacterium]